MHHQHAKADKGEHTDMCEQPNMCEKTGMCEKTDKCVQCQDGVQDGVQDDFSRRCNSSVCSLKTGSQSFTGSDINFDFDIDSIGAIDGDLGNIGDVDVDIDVEVRKFKNSSHKA